MSQSKKHPLEVFRSSQQMRGGIGGSSNGGDEGDSGRGGGDEPPEDSSWNDDSGNRPGPGEGMAIALTLPGLLTLVFAFVVLMAVSHYHGFQRGERSARGEMDATALERGRSLEKQVPVAPKTESSSASRKSGWYGVLVVTYKEGQSAIAQETTKILREQYGFPQFYQWNHPGGPIEIMVGASKKSDDPTLKDLEIRLRKIEDYPSPPKRPFMDARIKQHPAVPPDKLAGS